MTFDDPSVVVDELRSAPRPLLVVTDVDGTLSPIAPRPDQARLAPGALDALRAVAALDGVMLAVVSGRSLRELREQFGLLDAWNLVGSHGAESAVAGSLTAAETALRDELASVLGEIAAAVPGAMVEAKPVAMALHVRGASPEGAQQAMAAARAAYGDDARVAVHEGRAVYEIAVRPVTKAIALAELRRRLGPASVAFFGDDRSDETAFAVDGLVDIGVKVGTAPTLAQWRVADPTDVVEVLRRLASPQTK